jgi:hypothetical protein
VIPSDQKCDTFRPKTAKIAETQAFFDRLICFSLIHTDSSLGGYVDNCDKQATEHPHTRQGRREKKAQKEEVGMADDNDARFICPRCDGAGRVGNHGRDEPCEECDGEGVCL